MNVESMLTTYLSFWARLVLRARRPYIIGITGSVGKTTTKEVVAAVLMHEEVKPVVGLAWKTPGNMNNDRGVPLTLLGFADWPKTRLQLIAWLVTMPIRALLLATVRPYPRMMVLEYAAGPQGHVNRTARLAPPTIAVVTAVGPAHLEHFGTIERIVDEKSALVRAVPRSGLVVLGSDNEYASAMDRFASARVEKVPGRGRELSENAARVIGTFLGIDDAVVERALESCSAIENRLEVIELGSVTVINDAWNANPLSMRLGLDTLAERASPGQRRVAILGQMAELGNEAPRYHSEMASYLRQRTDVVIGVGALAEWYEPDRWFANSKECASHITELLCPGDIVLVKGSHSVAMTKIIDQLTHASPLAH